MHLWIVITFVITLNEMKSKKKNITRSQSGKKAGKIKPKTISKQARVIEKTKEGLTRSILNESNPSYSVSSRIRAIGNSKGVILSNRVIKEAGISPEADLIIQVSDGVILIAEAKPADGINTDISSWDKHYKNAIKKSNKPESDVWEGLQNKFDREEWT
jgi:antitoxin component of MazEF toxin-antitoxin module